MAFVKKWHHCVALVLLLLVQLTYQSINTNEVDDEDSGDFMDIASTLLQGSLGSKNGGGGGLGALGGILGTLMQGENGKQIGDMLMGMQSNKNNAAGDVLSSMFIIIIISFKLFQRYIIKIIIVFYRYRLFIYK